LQAVFVNLRTLFGKEKTMPAYLIVVLLFILSLIPWNIFGQDASAQNKAEQIAAALNKTKHKVKEKKNFRVEVFVEIKNEPAVRANPKEYSGEYEAFDSGITLKLEADAKGNVAGSGSELSKGRFTLRDGKINGAVLTATKIYESGATEKLEGVFVNRSEAYGTSPENVTSRKTTFGFGVPNVNLDLKDNGIYMTNLFYEIKR
jgi:hypothetical protein